jgi:hypothetical protein
MAVYVLTETPAAFFGTALIGITARIAPIASAPISFAAFNFQERWGLRERR